MSNKYSLNTGAQTVDDYNVGSLLGYKNNQILRERNKLAHANDVAHSWKNRAEELQDELNHAHGELNHLSSRFNHLSSRNDRLEGLIKSMAEEGVASNALITIHTLKAEALQKEADENDWSIEARREANLKLAAEAEYDYRLKNDPSYRMNTCADSLMKIAGYSDSTDSIRKIVGQLYATGKVRKDDEKVRLIAERVAEMAKVAQYANDKDTVPTVASIPPARLENLENDKKAYDSFSEVSVNPAQNTVVWIQPSKI